MIIKTNPHFSQYRQYHQYRHSSQILVGGLVSGRPFFCGGKSGGTIRTECYILRGADNKTWELVANLKTARFHHAGVSFGDSLWVTGTYVKLIPSLFKII